MKNKKTAGQELGLKSWEARSKGKTKKELTDMMRELGLKSWEKRRRKLSTD